jgi:hypothetical protein
MLDVPGDRAQPSGNGIIKSQLDLAAGLLLIALALIGYFGTLGLRFGQLTSVGPALMPRSVSVLIGAFGIGLVITSFLAVGPRLERWNLRGPVFVLGSVVLFALTIRGATLSLGLWVCELPTWRSKKVPMCTAWATKPRTAKLSFMRDRLSRFQW